MEIDRSLFETEGGIDTTTSVLGEMGYTVIKTEDFNTKIATEKQGAIDGKTSEFATGIEADIAKHFGIEKAQNERYYKMLERAGTEFSKFKDSNKALAEENETLKKGGTVDETLTLKNNELKTSLEADRMAFAEKETDWKSQREAYNKELHIIKNVKFNSSLPEDAYNSTVSAAIDMAKSLKTEVRNGKMILIGDDGTALMEKGEPVTVTDFLKTRYNSLFDGSETKEPKKANTGTGIKTTTKDGKKVVEIESVPDDVNTIVKLTEYLQKAGIERDNPLFTEYRNKFGKGLTLQ